MKLLTMPLISMLFLATAVEFAHAQHAVAARRYAVAKTYEGGKPMEESGVRCQGYKNVMQVGLGKSGTSSIAAFFTKEALQYNLRNVRCGAHEGDRRVAAPARASARRGAAALP